MQQILFDGFEIQTAEQIQEAWTATAAEVTDLFARCSPAEFSADRDGRWSFAQNLNHLTRSAGAVAKGLGFPKLLIRVLFGRGGQSRALMQLQADYKQKLAGGAQARGRFVPKAANSSQDEAIQAWRNTVLLLQKNLGKWNDKQLDNSRMPHPLLGKLTVREMLFFTIFHTQHHLAQCRST